MSVLADLVTVLIYGILAGGTFSLLALGVSLVFGVAKIIDFTYVAYIGLASYILYSIIPLTNPGVAIAISIVAILPLAFFVERFFIRPLRTSPNQVMMTTFGIALLVQYVIMDIWGNLTSVVPSFLTGAISLLGNIVSIQSFIILPVSIVVSIGLIVFIEYTKRGKTIIAVSQDSDAAWLAGINVTSTMTLTMLIGASLAATAAVISAPTLGLTPASGWSPFISAFVVVIIGGLGSIKGSVIAAYIYGIILNIVNVFVGTQWSSAIGFLVLITILLVRPEGVLSKHVSQ